MNVNFCIYIELLFMQNVKKVLGIIIYIKTKSGIGFAQKVVNNMDDTFNHTK